MPEKNPEHARLAAANALMIYAQLSDRLQAENVCHRPHHLVFDRICDASQMLADRELESPGLWEGRVDWETACVSLAKAIEKEVPTPAMIAAALGE